MIYLIIILVVVQRLAELIAAKRNEQWMREQGAFEAGASHYPYMLALHIGFFLSLLAETLFFDRPLSPFWPLLLPLFLAAQAFRIWCLRSLGRFWNTKILILPDAEVVRKGPYKWIKHPNYLVVTVELLILPLLLQAYATAVLFSLLNAVMLSVRIPVEEKALKGSTNYKESFERQSDPG
ncbi:isoprenylcysteine carboxylmethyltransferase family protein [Jeotgalibacillus sp. ET6]|uniref:isoprenylcysteine carboxyl methyltransferase family protein n=1 Tax=Jeotgalibacillus sp. ET6 TaxID=3037260 RepID=UPI002418A54C|nr:isoprenylcysteine carboxylmethyltransferase family protein [Jeotgalibacillus sp. ET6]MDG5472712.1 isoprenylcysteine carboxylmethyltransferase family protein [Jeotgalibacillus sp. ET6]